MTHEFEIGDVFVTLPEYHWKIEHRLVDVDTDDRMYYLKGNEATHANSKTVTESQLIDGPWKKTELDWRLDS